ncbi:MAG: penicillin-binding protein 2 [Lysobacteraceae bacterium]|nr:MAG: penicillin-binding protein 2 [Xanthomonadaceae bacterium]
MGPRRRQLKSPAAEAAQFRRRALLGFVLVVLALVGLGGWYFKLQVVDHADYALQSEANRVKLRPVLPGRGLILDRKGRVLADNVPAYRLDVTPLEAGPPGDWLPALRRIVALDDEQVAEFEAARKAQKRFRPITLKPRVDADEAARFAVDRWRFPGVELVPYLNRRYPYGPLLAHVIGYVGRVDEEDLLRMGEADSAFTHVGKAGLERYYDDILRGRIGYERVETNVEGRSLGTIGREPAIPGADLRLSIDLDLQRAMAASFGDMDGSAVALDPRTGEVLAMVSLPGYDPNLFVNGISHKDYGALTANPSRPLFNRNVLGGGPPGSTVKPFIGLAGLDSGLRTADDRVLSTGEFHIPGQRRGYRDSHAGGHGWTDLRKSISASVNTYYYKLALDMGIEQFADWMRRYGFGQKTGIDLVGENEGIVPSPEWKRKNSREPWYTGETVIAGIGQGFWKATTLQLVRATAAIADDGELRRVHLVSARRDGYREPWQELPQPAPVLVSEHPEHLKAVQEGMLGTTQPGGTAYYAMLGSPYPIAGKTGTAQKVSRKGSVSVDPHQLPLALRHQAWFIGYAPADNPTIAVAVAVEHGGFGSTTAAPIARKIMDAWILGKMPEPPQAEGAEAAPVVRFDNVVGAVNGMAFGEVDGAVDSAPRKARR